MLADLARDGGDLADRIVTTSPDVTVSTNLGGWVNRRGIFNRTPRDDVFREEKVVSAQRWAMSPQGQHIELGIAENNLFLLLGALGLSHSLFGARLLPIGTLYDPFIQRGLDALNYACYQDARFIVVATPSGVTLAPEGGAHQSIGTPLIGMAQDGWRRSSRLSSMNSRSFWPGPSITCSATARANPIPPGCATAKAARSICAFRRARSISPTAR